MIKELRDEINANQTKINQLNGVKEELPQDDGAPLEGFKEKEIVDTDYVCKNGKCKKEKHVVDIVEDKKTGKIKTFLQSSNQTPIKPGAQVLQKGQIKENTDKSVSYDKKGDVKYVMKNGEMEIVEKKNNNGVVPDDLETGQVKPV